MKRIYCDCLKEVKGEKISSEFVLQSVKKESSAKATWQKVRLTDASGEVNGKIFSENMKEEYFGMESRAVLVNATVDEVGTGVELTIESMKPIEKPTWEGIIPMVPAQKVIADIEYVKTRMEQLSDQEYRSYALYILENCRNLSNLASIELDVARGLVSQIRKSMALSDFLITEIGVGEQINVDEYMVGLLMYYMGNAYYQKKVKGSPLYEMSDMGKYTSLEYCSAFLVKQTSKGRLPADKMFRIQHICLATSLDELCSNEARLFRQVLKESGYLKHFPEMITGGMGGGFADGVF